MPIHGEVCIFAMENYTDTEEMITNKIEFDGDAEVPDGRSGIMTMSPGIGRTNTKNPTPFQERSRRPDTGFDGTKHVFNIFLDESTGKAAARTKLVQLASQDNTLDGRFRGGRLGLRNNYWDDFDLVPTRESGYKLSIVNGFKDLNTPDFMTATIELEFVGLASDLKANKVP